MTPEEIRDLLIRTVDLLERMELENVALRAVLGSALPRPGEAPLETQLNDLIRDAVDGPILAPIHTPAFWKIRTPSVRLPG